MCIRDRDNLEEVKGRTVTEEDPIISDNSTLTRKHRENSKKEEIINLSLIHISEPTRPY